MFSRYPRLTMLQDGINPGFISMLRVFWRQGRGRNTYP